MKQQGVTELHEELTAMQVKLLVKQCDISDQAQVQSILSDCYSCLPPLKFGTLSLKTSIAKTGISKLEGSTERGIFILV